MTIDDAYDLVMKSVEPFGERILSRSCSLSKRALGGLAANSGKDSGGYAADPYRVHPYVLMSWTGRFE